MATTFARGTVWWVGAGFMASVPLAIAGLITALRDPQVRAAAYLSSLALFVSLVLWMLLLVMRFA
jgi:hypothetical protein